MLPLVKRIAAGSSGASSAMTGAGSSPSPSPRDSVPTAPQVIERVEP